MMILDKFKDPDKFRFLENSIFRGKTLYDNS